MTDWATPNGKVKPAVEMHSSRGTTRISHHAALSLHDNLHELCRLETKLAGFEMAIRFTATYGRQSRKQDFTLNTQL